jgi:hypothetical protein
MKRQRIVPTCNHGQRQPPAFGTPLCIRGRKIRFVTDRRKNADIGRTLQQIDLQQLLAQ